MPFIEKTLLFDGSFDGFLSLVYAVYYKKIEPKSIQSKTDTQLILGEEPHWIITDANKAAKVFTAICEKISEEAAEHIYYTFLSADEIRFLSIVSYIRLGFSVGHMVDSHLHENFVRHVQKLAKAVWREAHLLYGFCRFAETKQGVYYCKVTPKNDVLPLLALHFSRRMNQPWVIHDKTRNQAAICDGKNYVLTPAPKNAIVEYAENEQETQELWVKFFNALAIEYRLNKKLQRQLLPLYFRGNMTEFNL